MEFRLSSLWTWRFLDLEHHRVIMRRIRMKRRTLPDRERMVMVSPRQLRGSIRTLGSVNMSEVMTLVKERKKEEEEEEKKISLPT
jgi:hypothetical protein